MSFDCSRFTFNPWNDYAGVVMQQGRVQLDSDWNEWLAEIQRRIQAGTMDTMGRAVYPATTPNAFLIGLANGGVTVGPGRMYVDGLLAENHGPPPETSAPWDPALAEPSGAPQGSAAAPANLPYGSQPYLPSPDPLPTSGLYLAYLDVWRRPVTYLEDPNLVEKAVGVDTTARLQTVWQVKFLSVNAGVVCTTPDSNIPNWSALIQPSGARLTTQPGATGNPGPCCLNATTAYTGMENQLYRVEIHDNGQTSGTPTFKWSRDNASVITAVSAIAGATNAAGSAASQLAVQSTGKDDVLCFSPGDWIEITDDYRELRGQPGELHQIDVNGVDKVNNLITLSTVVSAEFQNRITTPPANYPNCHARICRWDQGGKVYESDGQTLWCDLDDPSNPSAARTGANPGEIPVPSAGTFLILENGITVSFSGSPLYGDFWTFAARSADGTFDLLTQAPPQGVFHHYARLAMVNFSAGAAGPSDCRTEWPPDSQGGCSCECTITVQPGDLTATNTLQSIIQQYASQTAPVVICLLPGTYALPGTLRFPAGYTPITLKACQEGTVTVQAQSGQESQFVDGLVALNASNYVTLRGIQFLPPLTPYSPAQFAGVAVSSLDPEVESALSNLSVSIGIRAVNCSSLTIENCQFDFQDMQEDIPAGATPFAVGVFAAGQCNQWRLVGNEFAGVAITAGILMAPTVLAFNSPKRPPFPRLPINRDTLANALPTVSPPTKVAPAPTTSATAPADATSLISAKPLNREELILTYGTAMINSASDGGTVLTSSLAYAVFENNSFDELTIAALIVGQVQAIEFTRNECDFCQGGFWLLSPSQAGLIVYDPQQLALIGLSIALGYPLPQAAPTPAPAPQTVAVPAAPSPIRIYPGTTVQQDSQQNSWTPDSQATGVAISGGTGTYQIASSIAIQGATDPFLYQSERYGASFSYTFSNLPVGYYQVTLDFAEIFYTGQPNAPVGTRIFNVSINGLEYLINFNIVADAPGGLTADSKIFTNIPPTSVASNQGQIVISFQGTSNGTDQNAKISSVAVVPQWSGTMPGASPLGNFPNSMFINFYTQLTQLAQQAYPSSSGLPLQMRLTDNELHGLSSVAFLVLWDDQLQNGNASSLMMTGNRLDTNLPFSLAGIDNDTVGRLTALEGAAVESGFSALSYFYFYSGISINWVTRCVVSGNMLVNAATLSEQARIRFIFILNDVALPSPVATVPPPEISIAGNVFQGRVLVFPTPETYNSVTP